MDFQSNLAMVEDKEVEEKINIEDLVLPSEPTELAEIYINDITIKNLNISSWL